MIDRRSLSLHILTCCVLGRTAAAQNAARLPKVAVLDWDPPNPVRLRPFRDALAQLGYSEGRNISVDYYHAGGQTDRAEALAAEIAGGPVDVIVALATPAALAAQKATSTIPIVMTAADPVGSGLVANLARPGGNITGISNMMPDLESKRLELLREMLPGLKAVAFLGSTRDRATGTFLHEARAAAERSGLLLQDFLVGDADEIDKALSGIASGGFSAVIVQPLFVLSREAAAGIAKAAARHRLATISNYAHLPRSGGLLSYGPYTGFALQAAATYVDSILRGAHPRDLPVEQPSKFELVINLKTAAALGLTIPPSILIRADEVIE